MVYSVQLIWSNNAQTTLANSISNTATTANLASGSGVLFPAPSTGQGFTGTFTDAATGLLHEIVLVTGRTGDTITMTRAQEGTTGLNWTANDLFANLWTSGAAASLVQAYQLQLQEGNYAVDTGSANAYLVAVDPAIGSAPPAGFILRVKITNSNTTASTIDAGWGAVAIKRRDGSTLIGNELLANHVSELFWDGTVFQLLSVTPATTAAIVAGTDTQTAVTPAQLASTSFAPTGTTAFTAALSAPSGWLLSYGQAISRATYANLFAAITKSATVTITIATPGVVSWTSHGLVTGDVISFETTGALPTGLVVGTNYYVIGVNANTFQVATTAANALAGTAIATSGSQSGTQTCRQNPFGCGDGSTTFNVPDGRDAVFAGWTAMGGSARNLLGNNSSVGGFATAAIGNFAGVKDHVQTTAELVAHTHSYNEDQNAATAGSTGGPVQGNQVSSSTGSTGSGTAFNITQPTLLLNVIIKT